MKKVYPIQVILLRFQVGHNNPRKIQLFEDYRGANINDRWFLILIRHKEYKKISDGSKITEVTVFQI